MSLNLNLEFFDEIFTIAVLITFGIYHLLIYLGRKWYKVEKYHYYLSFIAFSIALYVFVQLFSDGFPALVPSWFNRSPLEVLLGAAGYYGYVKFSSNVFNFPAKKEKVFRVFYLFLFICFLTTIYSFINFKLFLQYFFLPIVITFSISILASIVVFAQWIISQKYYKDIIFVIISLGISLIMFNVLLIKALIVINKTHIPSKNYIFVDIGIIMITYALALKFNQEHKELNELKEHLGGSIKKHKTIKLHIAKNEIDNQLKFDNIQKQTYFNIKWETFDSNCEKYKITERQKEIIRYVSEGLEYKEIANILNISTRTVTRHIQNISEALDTHNKVDIINRLFN